MLSESEGSSDLGQCGGAPHNSDDSDLGCAGHMSDGSSTCDTPSSLGHRGHSDGEPELISPQVSANRFVPAIAASSSTDVQPVTINRFVPDYLTLLQSPQDIINRFVPFLRPSTAAQSVIVNCLTRPKEVHKQDKCAHIDTITKYVSFSQARPIVGINTEARLLQMTRHKLSSQLLHQSAMSDHVSTLLYNSFAARL